MQRRRRAKPAAGPAAEVDPSKQRLQKVLAAAGIGSRRHCEELIETGRVQIDGVTVTEMGTRVDPREQTIHVDGVKLPSARKVYYVVHKPTGVLSTNFDPSGRARVIDLLPNSPERLFTVGRLDMSSEGLIILTNDGELANQLTHPRYGVEKTYLVLVAGALTPEESSALTKGVHLAEGVAKASRVKIRTVRSQSTLLEIVLTEGRNREIRRLLAKVGHKVLRLKRIDIGGVRLGDLPPGEHRRLRTEELRMLRDCAAGKRRIKPKTGKGRPASAENLKLPKANPRRAGKSASVGKPEGGGKPSFGGKPPGDRPKGARQGRRRLVKGRR